MTRAISIVCWTLGLLAVSLAMAMMDGQIVHVVRYGVERLDAPRLIGPYVPHVLTLLIVGWVFVQRWSDDPAEDGQGTKPRFGLGVAALPLLLPMAVAAAWVGTRSPGVVTAWIGTHGPGFVGFCLVAIGLSWSVSVAGEGLRPPRLLNRAGTYASAVLLLAIAAATVWHTLGQIRFWRHFLLGYADFGFFTTELEHCLPWKDVGPLRFSDTRLGYHAVFMFYLLTPVYALFRSPVFLMVVSTLTLNAAAIPFYQLARRRSGSTGLGLAVAIAWLALPSLSRLPYSGTYGFQSIYLAVPWLAFCFTQGLQGKWRVSHLCLAGALLCEETVCGVAVGWGAYLFLFGGRRRDGVIIVAVSSIYLLLCTRLIIPYFDVSGQYTRLHLFGDEVTLDIILERLVRPRVGYYLLALVAPLAVGLFRGWRIAIAALPPLVLVLLLKQTDYLNLKYWHHTSMLVVLFSATVIGVTPRRPSPATGGTPVPANSGPVLGLLVGVLLMHWLLGSSPMAQAQRYYAAEPRLQRPDPKLAIVGEIRARFAPEDYVVIATERMAAHFIDYRMVRPAPGVDFEKLTDEGHLLVFDRSDGWDKLNIEGTAGPYLQRAAAAGFEMIMRRPVPGDPLLTVDVLVRPAP